MVNVTTEWKRVEVTNVMATGITGLKSVLFNIGSYVGTLFIDDMELCEFSDLYGDLENLNTVNTNLDDVEATAAALTIHNNSNDGIEELGVSLLGEGYDPLATYVEKTDGEKQAIVSAEMTKFIGGMMDAFKDNVPDWEIVREPLDSDDPSQLRSGAGKTLSGGEFYWQDYLGADYAVQAFKDAAQYGKDGDRLFICESGLVGNQAKCEALVRYVSYIESRGARVDGIGVLIDTQAGEVSGADFDRMFAVLAATGKLVRISGLSISASDEIMTESVVKEQGEAYRTVVRSYMDNVPAAQRAGIIQDSLIDDSGNAGLWNDIFSRKHAYGGFVRGLLQE